MLRTLTGARRKFSFDLALYRSREKKQDAERSAKAKSKTRAREATDAVPESSPSPRFFRPHPESAQRGRRSARGDDAPRIRELSRDASRDRTRTPTSSRQAPELPSAADSSDSDASPVARDEQHARVSRSAVVEVDKPRRAVSEQPRGSPRNKNQSASEPTDFAKALFGVSSDEPSWFSGVLTGSRGDSPKTQRPARSPNGRGLKPIVLQDPPSWQQLKAKALEADFASMLEFLEAEPAKRHKQQQHQPRGAGMPRSSSSSRVPKSDAPQKKEGPTFEQWFSARFPENQISSAPAAHKALWTEHERQARGRRDSRSDQPSYLDRLRGTRAPDAYKSGTVSSTGRALRDGGSTTVHTVTWRVERWSALPAGFRQGARYRPPGGAPWSLDLYKGGIKRERPGMIALYVHYDAPDRAAFATVTSLELALMNQTTGVHLARKHEGTRVFGPKADQRRRISTSAGTASLAHVVLTQVEALGFCVDDTVVLRAEIEVAPNLRRNKPK